VSVGLRVATRDDLPVLATLERSAMAADAWSPTSLAAELHGVPATRWVVVAQQSDQREDPREDRREDAREDGRDARFDARLDGRVVGYAVLRTVGDTADVHRVVVAEGFRGSGIGRQLVDAVVAEAARRGCTQALLEVAETNVGARALYAAAGFALVARREGYYRDGGAALVLRAEVPRRPVQG